MAPSLLDVLLDEAVFVVGPGAVVWTVSVELQLLLLTVAGEKLHVVLAGSCEQLSATGRLNPGPGVTVAV